jgi:hypothetical protein
MDARQFDDLVVHLTHRRRVLGGSLGTGLALLLAGAEPRVAAKRKKCKKGKKRCGKKCVSVKSDRKNCGACRQECAAAAVCLSGVCVTCPSGQTGCGTTCVDLTSNPSDCGRCGNACPEGTVCRVGQCAFCDSDQTRCGNACVDLATDPNYCGHCGNVCRNPDRFTCNNGACRCATADDCPGGCECIPDWQGEGSCGGAFIQPTKHCDDTGGRCGLGKVCQAFYGYCYAACSA